MEANTIKQLDLKEKMIWTREELKQMDQRTRKLMTKHKALHPRDDNDGPYVPRKEGGRGYTSTEDSVDTPIRRLGNYIKKSKKKD